MIEIYQTETFRKWRLQMKDRRARAIITSRLDRLCFGNPGDVKPVGNGISELRIQFGAGLRIYYTQRGSKIIILLCGGDKSTQENDIKMAKRLAALWSE